MGFIYGMPGDDESSPGPNNVQALSQYFNMVLVRRVS